MPCCISTTSESQPALAMTSAEKLDGTPSQLLMTGLPAFHNCRTPFGRAIGGLLGFKIGPEADPPSVAGRSQPALKRAREACSACFCWKFAGARFAAGRCRRSRRHLATRRHWRTSAYAGEEGKAMNKFSREL